MWWRERERYREGERERGREREGDKAETDSETERERERVCVVEREGEISRGRERGRERGKREIANKLESTIDNDTAVASFLLYLILHSTLSSWLKRSALITSYKQYADTYQKRNSTNRLCTAHKHSYNFNWSSH